MFALNYTIENECFETQLFRNKFGKIGVTENFLNKMRKNILYY